MENLKSHNVTFMTFVVNVTGWSDTQMNMMANRSDVKSLSMGDAVQEREALRMQNARLQDEIKRLKWMMTEHD